MIDLQKTIKKEVYKLKSKKHVDKIIFYELLQRVKKGKLTQANNLLDHFCAFFLPFNLKTKSIYLGHHKKANDWIPPGGHIEKNEHPVQTVKREFLEELNYQLKNERIKLFDLTIKPINNNTPCRLHWDLWYLIHTDIINFKFDKREFHNAGWHKLEEALEKISTKNYNKTVKKLKAFFSNSSLQPI